MTDDLTARLREVEQENDRLRAALANSDQPCAYCSLPADEWGKCQHGFPGCARADDAMGCPHLGASLEVDRLNARIAVLREALVEIERGRFLGGSNPADEDPMGWDISLLRYHRKLARAALSETDNRATEYQHVPPGHVVVPGEVIRFLRGECEIDGLWFDDRHSEIPGKYWWRSKFLSDRAMIAKEDGE